MSDQELLHKIAKGDSKAFESLFIKYKAYVYGLSRRILGAQMLAEENSQEVWIKVISMAHSFEQKGSVKAWILQITKNNALNIIRKRGWEEALPEAQEDQIADESMASEDVLEQAAKLDLLKAAIDDLPDRQRVAVVLWMHQELSMAEIAMQLDINVNAAKVLLFRAKENIKKFIEKFADRSVEGKS